MPQQASIALNRFPQIVWRKGKKKLWNPIHRQALKNRPEERVRLRVLEYLIHGGWSKHRISTEETLETSRKDDGKRTDIICYTQEFNPFLLIECKAENIKLSAKTALQIAQYNRQIKAPFLLLTNGKTDFWYELKEKKPLQPLSKISEPLLQQEKFQGDNDYNYWKDHGFAGAEAGPGLRSWLNQTLNKTIHGPAVETQYLSFKQHPADLDINHYYQIYKVEGCQIAMGFMATEYGGSRLTGILNRNGKNEAVIEINLDLLFDDRSPNASIYWSGGVQNEDVRSFTGQLNNVPFNGPKMAEDISSRMIKMIE